MVLTCIGLASKGTVKGRDNVLCYVRALCFSDLCCLLSVPMSVMDLVTGSWALGPWLCRVYWVMESGGKLAATFILTAVAAERWAVMRGLTSRSAEVQMRRAIPSTPILGSILAAVLVLLCPVFLNSGLETIFFSEPFFVNQINHQAILAVQKCSVKFEDLMYRTFNVYMLVLGFIIPATLIGFFYGSLVRGLQLHRKRFASSTIQLNVVASYSLAVTAFYYVCLTPYWLGNAWNLVSEWSGLGGEFQGSGAYIVLMYVLHGLPYVNAAFNWLPYAIYNTQLRAYLRAQNEPERESSVAFSRVGNGTLTNRRRTSASNGPSRKISTRSCHQGFLPSAASFNGPLEVPV